MDSGKDSKIAKLVDFLMCKVAEVADDEDWAESDGWVGKWTIGGATGVVKMYEIKDGKFNPLNTDTKQKFTGEVEMSEDTFLDLMDAALYGKGDEVFATKYSKRAIRYKGQQWVVDSERFRRVLKRISNAPIRSLL